MTSHDHPLPGWWRQVLESARRREDPTVSQLPPRSPYTLRHPAVAASDLRSSLHFLLQLGELLLRCGAASADVEASLIACASAIGLRDAEASVTYTVVQVSVAVEGATPATDLRIIRAKSVDHNRLIALHRLVVELTEGEIGAKKAFDRLAVIARARRRYPRWGVTAAWALLASAVTVQLGAGWVAALIAFATTVFIDRLGRRMARRNIPDFFLNLTGGAIVTAVAAALTAAGLHVKPSLIVAGGVVLLLPGLALMATVQDTLTGFMVTSAGRAAEVLILAGGIVGGIAFSLTVARQAGLQLPVQPELSFTIAGLPGRFVSAGVVATTMAIGLYAPARVLPPSFLLGGFGYVAFLALDQVLDASAIARGIIAVLLGLVSQVYAGRRRLPPLAVVVPAIVPMLPGFTIYAAMLDLVQGRTFAGVSGLLLAATEALALAAGIVLGEVLGQPLRREFTRFERRFAGPRLVGPIRVHPAAHQR